MANLSRRMPPPSPVVSHHDEGTNLGAIQISDDVTAAVARRYALSVPGVARLVGQSIVGGLANIIGKKVHDRAIRVEHEGERVIVTISLVVRFGEHVPTVATNVQSVCRKYIEELTGQQVAQINVVVQNLEVDDDNGTADDEEDSNE